MKVEIKAEGVEESLLGESTSEKCCEKARSSGITLHSTELRVSGTVLSLLIRNHHLLHVNVGMIFQCCCENESPMMWVYIDTHFCKTTGSILLKLVLKVQRPLDLENGQSKIFLFELVSLVWTNLYPRHTLRLNV